MIPAPPPGYHPVDVHQDPEALAVLRAARNRATVQGFRMLPIALDTDGGRNMRRVSILLSVSRIDTHPEQAGLWLHGSISDPRGVHRTYELLTQLHRIMGAERFAYQVFAAAPDHVNLNDSVLHLWMPIGVDPMPRFAGTLPDGTRTI